jgi:hypothetical protein
MTPGLAQDAADLGAEDARSVCGLFALCVLCGGLFVLLVLQGIPFRGTSQLFVDSRPQQSKLT